MSASALAATTALAVATPAIAQPEVTGTELVSLSDQAVLLVTFSDQAEPAAGVRLDGDTAVFRLEGVIAGSGLEKTADGLARRLDFGADAADPSITIRLEQAAHMSYAIRPGELEARFCVQPDGQSQCPSGSAIRAEVQRLADAEAARLRAEQQRAEQQRIAREQAEADRRAQRQAEEEQSQRAAAPPERRMITIERVNLRSGPGTSYGAIGLLQSGVRVIPGDEQGGWTKVQSYLGTGWVASEYLQPTALMPNQRSSAGGSGSRVGRTSTRVSLRVAPSVESERLLVLSADREVQILSETEMWVQVEVAGVTGWIYAEYVER